MHRPDRAFRLILSLFLIPWVFATTTFSSENEIALIPRSILFGNPEKTKARVSPNGQLLAFIAPIQDVLNIFIAPQGDMSLAYPISFDQGRGVRQYTWTYAVNSLIYSQDCDGDENTQLFLVNTKNQETRAISPKGSVSHLAATSSLLPSMILIANNQRTLEYFDIYSIDLQSGESQLFFENNAQFNDFIFDDHLQIRFASKNQPDGSVFYFQYDGQQFSPYLEIPFEDSETTSLIGLSQNSQTLYLSDSRDSDKAILWSIDLKSGFKHIIGSSDNVDLSCIVTDPQTGMAQGYIEDYLKPEMIFLDPGFKAKWTLASQIDPGDLTVVSRSLDDRIWILAFTASDREPSYHWFDTRLESHHFLFNARPELQKYPLNPLQPVIIKAQDGLEMVSYLTLPNKMTLSSPNRKPVPLVLVVHGGPVARDSWGYKPEHQWLSNRGFAVLAVNYRSSSGFGKSCIRAGDGEWSRKMHTDLLDAMQWAIDNNITTADQVAIYGGSYGGYAALVGLTMTPTVFKCGVDIVGPSNLQTLLENIPPYWAPYKKTLRRRLGLPEEESKYDQEILAKRSPLTFADQIKRPILIAQGANDPRVKQSESDQIVNILQEKKIPFTYMLFPTEGHGFARPENRKAFYAVTEQFLTKQFQLSCEPITSEIELAQVEISS